MDMLRSRRNSGDSTENEARHIDTKPLMKSTKSPIPRPGTGQNRRGSTSANGGYSGGFVIFISLFCFAIGGLVIVLVDYQGTCVSQS